MASRPRPSTFAIKVFWSEHSFYEKSRQWGKKRGRKKTRTKIVATNVVAWETAQTPTDWNAKSSCQYHRLPSRTRPICCAKTMTAKTYQNPLQDQDWERRDKTVSILNLQEETKTRLNSRLKARGSEVKSLSVFFHETKEYWYWFWLFGLIHLETTHIDPRRDRAKFKQNDTKSWGNLISHKAAVWGNFASVMHQVYSYQWKMQVLNFLFDLLKNETLNNRSPDVTAPQGFN